MRLILRAGGVLRQSPERNLVDDYLQRAQGLARGNGFLSVTEDGVDLGKCQSRSEETEKLLSGVPEGAQLILLDERGKSPTSRQIAGQLARWRDESLPAACWLIGGADGFEPSVLKQHKGPIMRWSFGAQTWPHKLVRVMAAEQIYRALSILAGAPYHRD